jgi:hypothetical protein
MARIDPSSHDLVPSAKGTERSSAVNAAVATCDDGAARHDPHVPESNPRQQPRNDKLPDALYRHAE